MREGSPAPFGAIEREPTALSDAMGRAVQIVGFVLAALAAVYLVSIVCAFASGWGLPTTAIIRWSPFADWLVRKEVYLSNLLLCIAAIGIATAYFRQTTSVVRLGPRRWTWLVLAVSIACLLVFSMSGMWAGLVRPGDFQYANLAGLVPYSDSLGHLAEAHDQTRDGVWSSFALRRPLAAAARSAVLLVSGGSYPWMQVLQSMMLASAMCFAVWRVAKWSGPWAALVFFALSYSYVRTFAPLTMTEGLALIPGLLIVPFVAEALRAKSLSAGLAALAFLVFALQMRMGSMFTIPALLLWLIYEFGDAWKSRFRIGAAGLAVTLAVMGLEWATKHFYGTPSTNMGTNFSYTLCGLTIGTQWNGCILKLGERSPQNEPELIRVMYAMAWDNFREHPTVLFRSILHNVNAFLRELPDFAFRGYRLDDAVQPGWFPRTAIVGLTIVSTIRYLVRPPSLMEVRLWVLIFVSIVASAGIIYLDDGRRALAVTYPLLFLILARVASPPTWMNPIDVPKADTKLTVVAIAILSVAAPTLLFAPWVANKLRPSAYRQYASLQDLPTQATVLGGRRLHGFLIVGDGEALRKDIPTVHLSDFIKILRNGEIEAESGLIPAEMPTPPFAVVFAPRLAPNASSIQVAVVPSMVLTRPDVQVWRWDWYLKASRSIQWRYVTRAEPIS